MSNIPEDVYLEILSRLPAKSAIICKCVCKTWFSLISNPIFVKLQHHRITQKNESKFMFLTADNYHQDCPLVSSISYDLLHSSLSSPVGDNCDDVFAVTIPPLKDSAYPLHFLGSCNGLICMMHRTIIDNALLLVVWNPTTTEYKILPKSQFELYSFRQSINTFGYDHKTDDYKFFKVVHCGTKDGYVAEMYTLRSDSWRSIDALPYMLPSAYYDGSSGVLVNGARHWLGACRRLAQEFILSLDFCEDKFEQLQLPKELLEIEHWHESLGVLEDCLCLLASVNRPSDRMEIWVMGDYGVQESWTKHLVIRHQMFLEFVSSRVNIIWSFADGKILIPTRGRHLLLYDTKKNTCTETKVRSEMRIFGAEKYVESLVALHSGIYAAGRNC